MPSYGSLASPGSPEGGHFDGESNGYAKQSSSDAPSAASQPPLARGTFKSVLAYTVIAAALVGSLLLVVSTRAPFSSSSLSSLASPGVRGAGSVMALKKTQDSETQDSETQETETVADEEQAELTWKTLTSSSTWYDYTSISAATTYPPNLVVAATSDGKLAVSSDYGASYAWTNMGTSALYSSWGCTGISSVAVAGDSRSFVAGCKNSKYLVYSQDAGVNMRAVAPSDSTYLTGGYKVAAGVDSTGTTIFYAVPIDEGMTSTHNSNYYIKVTLQSSGVSLSWMKTTTSANDYTYYTNVACSSDAKYVVLTGTPVYSWVSAQTSLVFSSDYGATFSKTSYAMQYYDFSTNLGKWSSLAVSNDGSKVVATVAYPSKTGSGEVVYSSDFGANFQVVSGVKDQTSCSVSDYGTGLLAAAATSYTNGYVYYVSSFPASTYVAQTTLGISKWTDVWSSPTDGANKYVVEGSSCVYCATQGLAYSQYAASTAAPSSAPPSPAPTAVPTATPTATYPPTSANEQLWTQIASPLKWAAISASEDAAKVVAVTSDGLFYYSANSGSSFQTCATTPASAGFSTTAISATSYGSYQPVLLGEAGTLNLYLTWYLCSGTTYNIGSQYFSNYNPTISGSRVTWSAAVAMSSSNKAYVYAVTGLGQVLYGSSTGGANNFWLYEVASSLIPSTNLYSAVACSATGKTVVVGTMGVTYKELQQTIYLSNNYALGSFTQIYSSSDLLSSAFSLSLSLSYDGSKIAAAFLPSSSAYYGTGKVIVSSDASNWTTVSGVKDQSAVVVSNSGGGLLASSSATSSLAANDASNGYVQYYTSFATSTSVLQNGPGLAKWSSVWCSSSGQYQYVASKGGYIYKSKLAPTSAPTPMPTQPSAQPSATPTLAPTAEPTTAMPTQTPTSPSPAPTMSPTLGQLTGDIYGPATTYDAIKVATNAAGSNVYAIVSQDPYGSNYWLYTSADSGASYKLLWDAGYDLCDGNVMTDFTAGDSFVWWTCAGYKVYGASPEDLATLTFLPARISEYLPIEVVASRSGSVAVALGYSTTNYCSISSGTVSCTDISDFVGTTGSSTQFGAAAMDASGAYLLLAPATSDSLIIAHVTTDENDAISVTATSTSPLLTPAGVAGSWTAAAASSDFQFLAAAHYGGYIFSSNDMGATWSIGVSKSTNLPMTAYTIDLAMSADGGSMVSVQTSMGGSPYMAFSADSGAYFTIQDVAEQYTRGFYSVAASADLSKIYAAVNTNAHRLLDLNGNAIVGNIFTYPGNAAEPTLAPTPKPTPTPAPTQPTAAPTRKPTVPPPTYRPTALPTLRPSALPTISPTLKPTAVPTPRPTCAPSFYPTFKPTAAPTPRPSSGEPTAKPTMAPTKPTTKPTPVPTRPSAKPTPRPTSTPTKKARFLRTKTTSTSTETDAATDDANAVVDTWTWSSLSASPQASYIASCASSSFATLASAVNGGQIELSSDSGKTWAAAAGLEDQTWTALACSSSGANIVAASSAGVVYYSKDAGSSWKQGSVDTADGEAFVSLAISSDGATVLLGSATSVYQSTNHGKTFALKGAPTVANGYHVAMSADASALFALATLGQLSSSGDAGETWTALTDMDGKFWSAITASDDGSVLAMAALYDQVYVSSDGGKSFTANSYSLNWQTVASSADGGMLAAAATMDYIYYSTDIGATWTASVSDQDMWTSLALSSDGKKMLTSSLGSNAIETGSFGAAVPTSEPTQEPTQGPTFAAPTTEPTTAPSSEPSTAPTDVPTKRPTQAPSGAPSDAPTESPSLKPTPVSDARTDAPTESPTQIALPVTDDAASNDDVDEKKSSRGSSKSSKNSKNSKNSKKSKSKGKN